MIERYHDVSRCFRSLRDRSWESNHEGKVVVLRYGFVAMTVLVLLVSSCSNDAIRPRKYHNLSFMAGFLTLNFLNLMTLHLFHFILLPYISLYILAKERERKFYELRRICMSGGSPDYSKFYIRSPVTRWASVAFGAGVGIGTAYKECSYKCGDCPMFRVPSTKPPRPASETLQVEHGQESQG